MAKFFIKNWHHFKQLTRYVISGGTSSVVNLVLLYCLTEYLSIWYLLSAMLSYVTSFFVSFFLQKFWTFRDGRKDQIRKQLVIYAGIAGFGLGVNALLMYFLVETLHIWYMFSQVIIGFILAFCNFLFYKFFVFNQSPQERSGSKKKVLITTGIYPPDVGGPATLLATLPQALRERGFKIKILTYSDVCSTTEEKEAGVFRVLREGNETWRYFKYFGLMVGLVWWADIIYVTDLYSAGRGALWLKRLLGRKYIIRFAGDSAWEKAATAGWTKDYIVDFENNKQELRVEKLKNQRRQILKNADCVIAVSHFMADLAQKIGVDNKKITMIYNAVDFFKNLPLRQESPTPILVFSGRLVPWKSQAVILKILARIKEKYPRITFEILGDGPELENLKKMAKDLGIESNVKIHGRLAEEKTHQIFARATIFVLNTNYEGLSHAVLNAMQVGVPVITTTVGGNAEVILDGENGLFVPYDNENTWQSAIEKLLDSPTLREKFSQNAKKTLEKFKFEGMVEKTVKVINEFS